VSGQKTKSSLAGDLGGPLSCRRHIFLCLLLDGLYGLGGGSSLDLSLGIVFLFFRFVSKPGAIGACLDVPFRGQDVWGFGLEVLVHRGTGV
jgi:hypothetical protein